MRKLGTYTLSITAWNYKLLVKEFKTGFESTTDMYCFHSEQKIQAYLT